MTELKSQGACVDCETEKFHAKLKGIGNPVATNERLAGSTHYDFLQCEDCGSIIARYRDRGLGKGGPFYKCLTTGLF